jgi:hypothetical protein
MRNLRKVSVITQSGKLVGVYVPPGPPADARSPLAAIVAGPRQKILELQIEVPQVLQRPKDIDAFHAAVRKQLKKGKRRH